MEGKMHRASTSGFSSQRSQYRIGICLAVVVLLILATACSTPPRDEFAQEVLGGIDKILSALEQYRANPSGKSTDPVDGEINGESVRLTGPEALLVSQSYAEIVGGRVMSFSRQLETVKFPAFMDIQSDRGYDKWAAATEKKLREKADKCLAIVEQIKSEYKANPDSDAFQSFFIGRPYRTVRMTPEGELLFAINMQEGVFIERVLKVDFREYLDGIHNQGKVEDKKKDAAKQG
jgi:hypothetical protein